MEAYGKLADDVHERFEERDETMKGHPLEGRELVDILAEEIAHRAERGHEIARQHRSAEREHLRGLCHGRGLSRESCVALSWPPILF